MTNPKKHYYSVSHPGWSVPPRWPWASSGPSAPPTSRQRSPWLILISLFFLLPGIVGIYRGPGVPSTHVIPRPKNRKPIDYAAGAGGAAGPAPTPDGHSRRTLVADPDCTTTTNTEKRKDR
jgi:hypothetical protein